MPPERPKVYVQHQPGPDGTQVVFSAVFSLYAAKELGAEMVAAAAKVFAEELLKDKELVGQVLDRERLVNEITAAIGRAFVEKLLGPGA